MPEALPEALPRPAAGSPFITKAHGTLPRRPGESGVSSPRVRRRLNSSHIRTVSKRRFLSPRALRPRTQSELDGDDEALIGAGLPGILGKRFSGAPCGPLLPTFRDLSMTSRTAFPVVLRSPSPSHCPVRAYRRTSGPSTRGPTPSPRSETRLAAHPRLRAGGYGEHTRPFPTPVVMIGGIQLSGPYEPRSGSRLVLGLALADWPRPSRPPRTRKAS